MVELPLILLGGLLGSAHCLGMCGPLAVFLSAGAPEGSSLFRRQILFSVGRVFTYGFLGALAGFGGAWLTTRGSGFIMSQATLAILAGMALVLMGLVTAGIVPRPVKKLLGGVPCGASTWLKTILSAPGWWGPMIAGVFTGFIPCGLVYAFLLKAGSTGNMGVGMLTMLAFGLGTLPLMILVGLGGQYLPLVSRAHLFRVAAWCVVVTGAISIARGAVQFQTAEQTAAPACPFCAADEATGADSSP
jgi:sulfite exporter TauE/SafE